MQLTGLRSVLENKGSEAVNPGVETDSAPGPMHCSAGAMFTYGRLF